MSGDRDMVIYFHDRAQAFLAAARVAADPAEAHDLAELACFFDARARSLVPLPAGDRRHATPQS